MARYDTVYASAAKRPVRQRLTMVAGEKITLRHNLNGALSGATVSSSAWATESSAVVTLSGAANSGGIASTVVEALYAGRAEIKNTATLSDGRKYVQWFVVGIEDEDDL